MTSPRHINAHLEIPVGVIQQVNGDKATCELDSSLINKSPEDHNYNRAVSNLVGVGTHLKVQVEDFWLIGEVTDVWLATEASGPTLFSRLSFLGEGTIGNEGALEDFKRGISHYPRPGATLVEATRNDLSTVFGSKRLANIEIGAVFPTFDVRAQIGIDALLSKHFAIFGSTGTGKSTLAVTILRQIIDRYPAAHVILIDPHGEYRNAFPNESVVFNIDNLKLPYWIMNFEEHCEALITSAGGDYELDKQLLAKCLLAARNQNERAGSVLNLNVDTPLPYAIFDLQGAIDTELGRLEKLTKTSSYFKLKMRIDDFIRDKRFSFMFDPELYRRSLIDVVGGILRVPNEGKPVSIIDTSRVPSEISNVVVALISRLVLDYGIWAREEELSPIMMMCEEAQRYAPSFHIAERTAAEAVLQRIAKEGRKYGVSLGIICQRPSDISEAVLSQCGTVISMRLNNARDQNILRDALTDNRESITGAIQSLRDQECIICGEAVSLPMRVSVDDVKPELRPHSEDPVYTQLWKDASDEKGKLERLVSRWVKYTR